MSKKNWVTLFPIISLINIYSSFFLYFNALDFDQPTPNSYQIEIGTLFTSNRKPDNLNSIQRIYYYFRGQKKNIKKIVIDIINIP